MGVGISSGGPVSLIYGLMFTLSGTLACAASIAEMASVCPISGAQFHWTYMFAPKKWRVFITFIQGTCACGLGIETILTCGRMGNSLRLASYGNIFDLFIIWPTSGRRDI